MSLSLSVCRQSVIRAGVSISDSVTRSVNTDQMPAPGPMLGPAISHGSLTPGIKTQSPATCVARYVCLFVESQIIQFPTLTTDFQQEA